MSVSASTAPLIALLSKHEIGNLIAKHGALRAVYPVLDERELLVTCEKVIRRDIFGITKYVGSWGIRLHSSVLRSLADKGTVLERFETYLVALDCPETIIQSIVTVGEELILNAVVHAPRTKDGTSKYASIGPQPGLVLEPEEYVQVSYGCDGQRLMLSVSDNFGMLERKTLHSYLSRGIEGRLTPEVKPSGAGLGLTLSLRGVHQLIFNIQDHVRTEVIAGWYLRVNSSGEFRQIAKSLNVFWLPKDSVPAVLGDDSPALTPEPKPTLRPQPPQQLAPTTAT
jgi:hypothetical protein